MISPLVRFLFICFCLIILSSWVKVEEEPSLVQETVTYNEKQFFQDAFNYRLKNNLEIPSHYYDILGMKKNQPLTIATPIKKEPIVKSSLIPEWIIIGILKRETKSYYDENGNIVYVDRTIGKDGEKGPFQMTPIAFIQVKKRGETHNRLMYDTAYAQDLAERYLLYLYNGPAKKNWNRTIRMYNGGQNNYLIQDTLDYLADVKKYGFKKISFPL